MTSRATRPLAARADPRTIYPRPPFPSPTGDQSSPERLDPRPDHGEDTYVGSGRMAGLQSLITGGDSGIGRAVAIAFAREGAEVAVVYREERADAEETVRLIDESGQRGFAIQADLALEDECRDVIKEVIQTFDRIDVLVNNAATQRPRAQIEDISIEEWERTLRTNLTGPFLLCREAARHMGAGASIINVASIQASKPSGHLLAYATSKGGLVTFSRALAELFMVKGIRVNVVAPGPVWTPLVATTTDPQELTNFGNGTLLGRPAQPAELAAAFVFLASAESSYVTGEILAVTGGELYS